MYLVQLLLPLTDNAGAPFPKSAYRRDPESRFAQDELVIRAHAIETL